MSAATLSPRRRRSTILATSLADLDGLALVVDCLTLGCAGERNALLRDLAGLYGKQQTFTGAVRRMRCTGCQGRAGGGSAGIRSWRVGASPAMAVESL